MNKALPRLIPAAATALALVIAAPVHTGSAQAQVPAVEILPARDGMPTLAPLVQKVVPAVVHVRVRAKADMASAFPNEQMFRFFNNAPPGASPPRDRQSGGSGIIIDADKGYILTNHHVIDNATEITITLHDRRVVTAKVIGSDKGTDIALLQIDADNLTALPIGDSGELRVGDYVVAVGSPFGLQETVTSGIVSALSRANGIGEFEDFIQTDASINPGNSGGPLINLKGELVGVNTAILGPSGGNVGIGFAVPTSMAKGVITQLVEYGEVRRGRIGVSIQDMTPEIAANLGVTRSEGALIAAVESGTPADSAGLRAGDVVVELDGKALRSNTDLRNRLAMMPIGTTVDLGVLRDGQKRNFKVKIGKTSMATLASLPDREALAGASFASSGKEDRGVRITEVERGSPAERSGLEAGDVITAVNRKPVNTVEEFSTAMKGSLRSTVLAIQRGDEKRIVVVP